MEKTPQLHAPDLVAVPRFRVQKKWYDLIRSGEKIYEGRPANKLAKISPGSIVFIDTDDQSRSAEYPGMFFTVSAVILMESITDVEHVLVDWQRLIPGAKNINDVIQVYRTYYPDIMEIPFGVMRLKPHPLQTVQN